ncbi:hypothetical protein ACQKDS_03435 [Serratia sp. NPDC078593]|uniref:hypothetical protein n=1 Tax=unclassified Serratia (in: enterobacteria) TaxID=2647522 RepID=UPI0037D4B76C
MTIDKKELRDAQEVPSVEELKERFKAGSIPLQTDFANLIDVAEHGRKAVGKSKGQTGPANGFILSDTGRLELKVYESGGVKVDANGINVLSNDTHGIHIDQFGVGVKLYPGHGLEHNDSGLGIKVNDNKGITVDKDGVGVKLYPDWGLEHDSSGIWVKVNKDKGLEVDKDGIGLKPEQSFQKGMVMMFAGSEAEMPKGWALCDGKEGRPDLRDRFVLGAAAFSDVNKTNNQKVTGSNEDKQCSIKSDAQTPNISVTVNEHALSVAQIPEHNHLGGMRSSAYGSSFIHNDVTSAAEYGSASSGKSPDDGFNFADITVLLSGDKNGNFSGYQLYTSKMGGSKPHNHDASAIQDAHQHNINVVPPYYILAFIIKL